MPTPHQTIFIQPLAPPKPVPGAVCNGCGVCCLSEPCPLGVVVSGKRSGACDALRWQATSGRYLCGAISEPEAVLRQALPGWLRGLTPGLGWLLGRLAARWVAAGQGCDSTLEVERVPFTDNSPHGGPN
jgi:hypothetical protein